MDVVVFVLLLVEEDTEGEDEDVTVVQITLLERVPIEGSVKGMKVPVDDARLGVGTTRGDVRLHDVECPTA